MHVLDRLGLLGQGCSQGVEPNGPSLELQDHGFEELAVERLQADLVDLQHVECVPRDVDGRAPVAAHLRVVAYSAQQAVGYAGRAPRTACDLGHRVGVDLDVQDPRRASDDFLQLRLRVEVEAVDRAESVAQRPAQQALSRRSSYAREVR